ncbi:hypothetical protein NA78x_006217 [Anatilimnocola sp. NA78]|uniref:hypothetical protein n=1 Tax=Anatilimnocola sp. NA78 TaxID=3415683 RepID=UPI003CE55D23
MTSMLSVVSRRTILALTISALCLASTAAAQTPKATPSELAKQSFEALKAKDLPKFVGMFHSAELKRFKDFAVTIFKEEKPPEEIAAIRKQFAPYQDLAAVNAATSEQLMSALLQNSLLSIPGIDTILGIADLTVMGEIPEGADTVHVITRSFLPRPQPVSFQKENGEWKQMLTAEMAQLVKAIEQKEAILKKGLKPEEVLSQFKIEKLVVLGHVPDSEERVQVLARTHGKFGDFETVTLGCYPVTKADPAWQHLADKDKTKLNEALQKQWVK